MKRSSLSDLLAVSIFMAWLLSGCTSPSTPIPIEPTQTNVSSQPTNESDAPPQSDEHYSITEVEELAGFDVKEPVYLPDGVSFEYATYQKSPYPNVTLHFKLVHKTYGDMGVFFQIVQEPQAEAMPNPNACGTSGTDCEAIQIGDMTVKYRLSAPTESLMWDADGFSFQLLRTAGEPNKTYKDELLKVVGSIK
ncbi:MAG: DUF4367 domain-containing protein [Anaerolineales bacterium]|nr:DUF4367 domain-containing protein [Anaerolineales bacterium]